MRIHSQQVLGVPVDPSAGRGKSPKERMDSFVGASTVFLLVKGTPQQPMCGFSATVIDMFNRIGAPYATFNVLDDPEIRVGAKDYSNWPTFPQVYVSGEFLGGCDIATEMYQSGEMGEVVKEAVEAKGAGPIHEGKGEVPVLGAGPAVATGDFSVPESAKAEGAGEAEVLDVTPQKVQLLGKEHFVLVDVREPDEFSHTRIEGANLMPLGEISSRWEELPTDANLLMVCRSGGRSRRAGEFLIAKGFRHVYNLAGGTNAWSEVDDSVTRY